MNSQGALSEGWRRAVLVVLAVATVAAFDVAASVDQLAMTVVILLVGGAWCVADPVAFAVLILPSLIPYYNTEALPQGEVTVVRVVTVALVLSLALRGRRTLAAVRRIPGYLWGWGVGMAAAYLLASVANDWPEYSETRLQIHLLRVALLFSVFVCASQVRDLRLVLLGWALLGVRCLVWGGVVWELTGNLVAARYATLPVGDLLGMSTMVAAWSGLAPLGGFALLAIGQQSSGRGRRAAWAAVGLVVCGAVLFSGRREGLLGLAISGAVLGFVGWGSRGLAMSGAIALLLGALYYAGPLQQFLDERESVGAEFRGEGTGRAELASSAIDLWQMSPVFGYGPASHVRLVKGKAATSEGGAIHNSVTGGLVEAGVLGGVAALALLGGVLWQWLRVAWLVRREGTVPSALVGWGGVTTAASMVADVSGTGAHMIVFGVVAGVWTRLLLQKVNGR